MVRPFWFIVSLSLLVGSALWMPGCGTVPTTKDAGGTPDVAGNKDASASDANAIDAKTPEVKAEEKPAAVATSIETQLGANTATAGELVVVTCKVLDQDGAPFQATTKVVVTPAPKGTVSPTDVVINEAGIYKVACQLDDGSLVDSTPETLTIVGGEASLIETEVKPNQVRAGETATVTCRATDTHGNALTGATIQVTPKDGITIKGQDISGTKIGQYQVACAIGSGATAIVDSTPATLEITPGLPARMVVTPDPSKAYYKPEETVLLERKVFDAYDNEVKVPHADISVVVTPDTDIDKQGFPDSIAMKKDGEYKVVVSITSKTAEDKPVAETLTLQVDGSGPAITLTSPARAEMLTGTTDVVVTGTAIDGASGLATLKVNGKQVTPDAMGNFTTTVPAIWGINILIIDATDKAGNPGYRAQSFIWSKEYRAMGGKHIAKAALARLNQKALDDGDRNTVNDLATILELVMNTIDIDQEIPITLTSGTYKIPPFGPKVSYKVTKTGKATMGRRELTLKPRVKGLTVTTRIYDIRIPLRGEAASFLRKSAVVSASYVDISGDINVEFINGKLSVSVPRLTADVSKVEVTAFGGIWKFLNGAVTSVLRSSIKKALEKAITGAIPEPVEKFVLGIKLARSFNLTPGLGNKTINLDSTLDYLVFDAKGGTIGLAASLTTAAGITNSKRGTPLRANTLPTWSGTPAFGIAFSDNMLNQVLTTAWISGALTRDISSTVQGNGSLPLDPQGLKVKVEALLPPILHAGAKGHDAIFGIGDLFLDIEFTLPGGGPVKAKAYLSANFGTKLGINSKNELTVQLAPTPVDFAVDVVQVTGLSGVNIGELGKLLQSLAPQISQFFSTSVLKELPIPDISLDSFAGKYGIPPGTSLTLKNGQLSTANDYVSILGDL